VRGGEKNAWLGDFVLSLTMLGAIYPVKWKSASIFFHKFVALGTDRAGTRKLLTLYKKIDNCRSRRLGFELHLRLAFRVSPSSGTPLEWWSITKYEIRSTKS
jgi:hypothetical protein